MVQHRSEQQPGPALGLPATQGPHGLPVPAQPQLHPAGGALLARRAGLAGKAGQGVGAGARAPRAWRAPAPRIAAAHAACSGAAAAGLRQPSAPGWAVARARRAAASRASRAGRSRYPGAGRHGHEALGHGLGGLGAAGAAQPAGQRRAVDAAHRCHATGGARAAGAQRPARAGDGRSPGPAGPGPLAPVPLAERGVRRGGSTGGAARPADVAGPQAPPGKPLARGPARAGRAQSGPRGGSGRRGSLRGGAAPPRVGPALGHAGAAARACRRRAGTGRCPGALAPARGPRFAGSRRLPAPLVAAGACADRRGGGPWAPGGFLHRHRRLRQGHRGDAPRGGRGRGSDQRLALPVSVRPVPAQRAPRRLRTIDG